MSPTLWGWLSRDPLGVIALTLGLVAGTAPLWVSVLLPMMDLPQHLATVRILHSYGDPVLAVAKYHIIDFSRTQYLSWYLLVDALAWAMPLETANRVVLSLYAVGLPLSVVALLRSHRRDPVLALLAVPLVYNVFFFMGFANFITALPLMLWGLALLQRCLGAPTWPRVASLAALSLLLFYSHAQPFLLYGLLGGVTVLLGSPGWHPRHWYKTASHILPALIAMGVWTSRSLILAGESEWKQGLGGRNVAPVKVQFEPIGDRLHNIWTWWLDAYRDDSDEWLAVAWLALLLTAALAGSRCLRPTGEAWWRDRTPAVLTVITLAVCFLSPVSWKWIWPISYRFIPIVALLAIVCLPAGRWVWGRWGRAVLFVAPALSLVFWASWLHMGKARAFSDEAGPIREIVAKADPGKKLLALIYGPGSQILNQAPLIHMGQYYVVDRGGMASFSFANFPQSPVLYPDVGGPPAFPARFEWTPERFSWDDYGAWYDYFLLRGPGEPFGRHRAEVALVAEMGPYRLFRRSAGAPSAAQRPEPQRP